MKKILGSILLLTLLSSCAESLALLGPTSTAVTGGNIAQSALSSAVNYGVKKQTGKTPLEHAMAYTEEKNPERKKETCISSFKITKSKILKKSNVSSIKDLTSSLQPNINKKSKIKYLD